MGMVLLLRSRLKVVNWRVVSSRNALAQRPRGLTGRRRFAAMRRALVDAAGEERLVFDLELVYGHCWGTGPRKDPADFRIPASGIPRRTRRG